MASGKDKSALFSVSPRLPKSMSVDYPLTGFDGAFNLVLNNNISPTPGSNVAPRYANSTFFMSGETYPSFGYKVPHIYGQRFWMENAVSGTYVCVNASDINMWSKGTRWIEAHDTSPSTYVSIFFFGTDSGKMFRVTREGSGGGPGNTHWGFYAEADSGATQVAYFSVAAPISDIPAIGIDGATGNCVARIAGTDVNLPASFNGHWSGAVLRICGSMVLNQGGSGGITIVTKANEFVSASRGGSNYDLNGLVVPTTAPVEPYVSFANKFLGIQPVRLENIRVSSDGSGSVPNVGDAIGFIRNTSEGYTRAVENLFLHSEDFSGSSSWSGAGDFTITTVNSILGGSSVAYRHLNSGSASSRNRGQILGAFPNSAHTATIVVEQATSDTVSFGIYDGTATAWVIFGRYTFSTDSIVNASSTVGTNVSVSREIISESGPNGGRVVRLSVTGTPVNVGNSRRVYIYPSDTVINTNATILHWAQLEEASAFSSYQKKTITLGEGGNHLYQTSTPSKAILFQDVPTGKYFLRSDGVDDFYIFTTPVNVNDGAMYFAMRDRAPSGTKALIAQGVAGYMSTSGTERSLLINAGGSSYPVNIPSVFTLNSRKSFRINKTQGKVFVRTHSDSTEYTNTTDGATSGLTAATTLLAFNNSASIPMQADVFGFAFAQNHLSSSEDQIMLDYLAKEAGLEKPYIENIPDAENISLFLDFADQSSSFQTSFAENNSTVNGIIGFIEDKSIGTTLGTDKVTNGNFSSGTTGWTTSGTSPSTWSIASGVASINNTGGTSSAYLNQLGILTSGKWYEFSFDIVSSNGIGGVRLGNATDNTGEYKTSVGKYKYYLKAGGATPDRITFQASADWVGSIDNVSVREINWFPVFQNTTSRKPLLTVDANNVSRATFSTDDVLEIDASFFTSVPTADTTFIVVSPSTETGALETLCWLFSNGVIIKRNTSGNLQFYDGVQYVDVDTAPIPQNEISIITRQNSNGKLIHRINGQTVSVVDSNISYAYDSGKVTIGNNSTVSLTQPFNGSIYHFSMYKKALSLDDLKKMEKFLAKRVKITI